MQFDTKIAVVVRDDLPTWQKLNMTPLRLSGIALRANVKQVYKVLRGLKLHP